MPVPQPFLASMYLLLCIKLGINMELQVEQVISELSKIHSATEKVINSAVNEKDDYAKEIEQKTKAFDDDLEKKLQNNLDQYKVQLKQDNDKILAGQLEDTKKLLANLDESFEKQHTSIAKNIFTEITRE